MAAIPEGTQSQCVKTLENLAMDTYLLVLQDACYGYIQMERLGSLFLKEIVSKMIPTLREQLSSQMFGVQSTSLRQDMIKEILSGRFPTAEYHNQYDFVPNGRITSPDNLSGNNNQGHPDTSDIQVGMDDSRIHGRKCNSICCTGAFIVETMLCVVINEDVREIRFDKKSSDHFWHKSKSLKRYVPIQIPSILAHYSASIYKHTGPEKDKKKPMLERLIIQNSDLTSKTFAIRNNHFDVLTSYPETLHYLEIPGKLSSVAGSEYQYEYGGFSEHLMVALTGIFDNQFGSFPKMTELILGREALNTMFKMKNPRDGSSVSVSFFRGIGRSCPNLRILDISGSICLSPDFLILLFFRDAYHTLHSKNVYLPEFGKNFNTIVQNNLCDPSQIRKHDLTKYCPFCFDEWCKNNLRSHDPDIRVFPIDDRLYDEIQETYEDPARLYLINVIKVSDLVHAAINEPECYMLKRPHGPKPWNVEWHSPFPLFGECELDGEEIWYSPEKPITYRACTSEDLESVCQADSKNDSKHSSNMMVMNKIVKSLQVLKLNIDSIHPKYELVPFLLAIMPQLKTLGHVDVVRGLKMIRDIPSLSFIRADSLEELEFVFGSHHSTTVDVSWADNDVYEFVENFGMRLKKKKNKGRTDVPNTTEKRIEDIRAELVGDIELISNECPNLRKLLISLFGDFEYLNEQTDAKLWNPFTEKLTKLEDFTLHAHKWSHIICLLKTLKTLPVKKLYLSLNDQGTQANGPGQWDQNQAQRAIPNLENLLEISPNLEYLTCSFSLRSVDISDNTDVDGDIHVYPCSSLRNVVVHTYMTKRAFNYLWAKAKHLISFKVTTLISRDQFPRNADEATNHQLNSYNEVEITRLFRSNSMKYLEKFNVEMTFKNIETAKMFVDFLPHTKEITTLNVRVGLSADDFENQELMLVGLAQIMRSMKTFKDYCNHKQTQYGQKIVWRWQKYGFLESLSEMGPLNDLVDANFA
jgi:hypothetical protein